MGFVKDITGMTFGRLTVIELCGRNADRSALWRCKCECGNETILTSSPLKKGSTTSCGCYRNETSKIRSTSHGETISGRTTEYTAWKAIKTRCYNKNIKSYADYGARGITVCDRWKDSFQNFLSDMGRKPSPKHSLDRFPDINGNYEPSNCRWATQFEQAQNKRNNRWYEHNGIRLVSAQWGRVFNISPGKIEEHIKRGKSFEQVYIYFLKTGRFKEPIII